ncbi:hypothetical protein SG34_025085 [Thalassomonas viridans]|uniref:Uncharacterized protein n=1 Tax=Thalassomonas viridans TaxID=137584 RepID=A0AAE9Z0V4_9GAMM|nr:hypothetical protein [Thalassomonas viridans]WDE04570.1 hypothetical protein SG34_025085 [Thalassomonas viridans]
MFKQIVSVLLIGVMSFISNFTVASETITYQQGVDDYLGATSVKFGGNRYQDSEAQTHYFRYDGTRRIYNIEHFELGDLSLKGKVESAKLIFYRAGGDVYTGSDIYVRQVQDPDNLGQGYATGWKVGSGFRAGANNESRDDSGRQDVKWRLSDPDSPDDLNADYFQGVLKDLALSPFFTPRQGDKTGALYEVDVTADLVCMQKQLCANQGWALFHSDAGANIQHFTANSNYPESRFRPKLVVTYGAFADELEPLVIESFPYNDTVSGSDNIIELSLLTNESARCKYDTSPVMSFDAMRYQLASQDGLSHSASWPVAAADTRYQLYGKCRDEWGNTTRTPHVFTFMLSDDAGGIKEPPGAGDLLPGLNPAEVWKTLYTTTGQDLTITLGDLMIGGGNNYAYQVAGHASCAASVVGNQCTFNNDRASTELLTVSYSVAGTKASHKIVVVTVEGNGDSAAVYNTSRDYIEPDYGTAPPVKGESRVDPTTGLTITRLTDATEIEDSEDALIVYSRYSPENSSGEYVLIFGANSTTSRVINRKTGELVAVLTDESGSGIGENHEVRWDNSGRHPNRVYYVFGMKFWMIKDVTDPENSRELVKDFSEIFPNSTKIYNDSEGDSSNDSDHWAWMAVHYDFDIGQYLVDSFVHYQISTDTVHTLKPADLAGTNLDSEKSRAAFTFRPNMVEMSPLGTGVILHFAWKFDDSDYGGKGGDYIGTWYDGAHLWPLDFDHVRKAPLKVSCCASHSGWAFDENHREMFISQNNLTDGMDAVYIEGVNAGYDNRIETINQREYGYNSSGFHFGKMPMNRAGWLFMSTYSSNHETWGKNQFMMIQTKPSEQQPVIWRLGHTHTKFSDNGDSNEYRNEAAAAVNMAGNRIYWTSNWGGLLEHREAFMMELPDNWDQRLSE